MRKISILLFSLLFLELAPASARSDYAQVYLKTSDNVKIAINHYKNGFDKVLIIAPGWFMTKDSKAFLAMADVFSKNMDVIVVDFRGHGKSSGYYTFSQKETMDLEAVVNYARSYKKVYLMGFSMGAAVSLIHCAKHKNIDKLIVVSAPCDFNKIENHMYKKEAWLPTLQKFEPGRWMSVRPSLIIGEKIKPLDIVTEINAPTLLIAGKNDPTVYPWHTQKLYEKAVCKKSYELFKDCNHAEDLFLQSKDKFINACLSWLSSPAQIPLEH